MNKKSPTFLKKYNHIWTLLYIAIYMPWFMWLEKTVTTEFHLVSMPIDYKIPFCEYFIIPYFMWFLFVPAIVGYEFFYSKKEYYQCCAYLFSGMTIFLIICTIWHNGLDLRQAAQEAVADGVCALAQLALVRDRVGKGQMHLLAQVGVDLAEQELRKRLSRDVRHRAAREIRREEHLLQILNDLDDDLAVGHAQVLAVHGHLGGLVAVGDLCGNGVQQTFLCHDGQSPFRFSSFFHGLQTKNAGSALLPA